MLEQKPPRFLITSGDNGQMMTILPLNCMEDMLFKHLNAAIKGFGRSNIEGDGSAWDTCCSVDLRA